MSTPTLIAVEFSGKKLLLVIRVLATTISSNSLLTFLFSTATSVRVKREPSEEGAVSSHLGPGTDY